MIFNRNAIRIAASLLLAGASSSSLASNNSITLQWEQVEFATQYKLEQQLDGAGTWTTAYEGSDLTAPLDNLADGNYVYRVIGCIVNPAEPDTPLCEAVANYSEELPVTLPLASELPISIETAPAIAAHTLPAEDTLSSQIGTLAGQFRVDESGSATYSVPIAVPTGIAGVSPQLGLSYSSAAGNGAMGVGWNIGGRSEIQRCRQTIEEDNAVGAVTLTAADALCLDGQRLVSVGTGAYGDAGADYRTKIDSMRRITGDEQSTSATSTFTVENVDGSTHVYGYQITDTDSDVPYRWLLSSITDNMGNAIAFNYNEAAYITGTLGDNEHQLTSVSYSGNTVGFHYITSRSDRTKGYMLGNEYESKALLNRVVVNNHDDIALRSYHMAYKLIKGRSVRERLETITQCDGSISGTCLPATEFSWLDATSPFGVIGSDLDNTINISNRFGDSLNVKPLDYNGDGKLDISYGVIDGDDARIYVYRNNGSSFSYVGQVSVKAPTKPGTSEYHAVWHATDIDGDGNQEILYLSKDSGFHEWHIRKFTGSSPFVDFVDVSNINADYNDLVSVVDIDADGWQDIVYTQLTEDQYGNFRRGSSYVMKNTAGTLTRHSLSTRRLGFTPPPSNACFAGHDSPSFTSSTVNFDKRPPMDINGDGIPDLVMTSHFRVRYHTPISNCGGYTESYVDFSREAGYSLEKDGSDYVYREAFPISSLNAWGISNLSGTVYLDLVGDINGDGLADLIRRKDSRGQPGGNGSVSWRCDVSTGTSMTPYPNCNIDNINDDARNFSMVDLNGDGRTDLVYNYNDNWYARYAGLSGFGLQVDVTGVYQDDSDALAADDYAVWADFDGDSYPDLLRVDTSDTEIHITYDRYATPTPRDMIDTITNGFGVETDIDYKPLTDATVYTKGSGAESVDYGAGSKVFDIIGPSYVVSNVHSDAPGFEEGDSNTVSVAYHYENMRAQAGGRGMLGFEKIRTYDPQTNVTTESVYHQEYPLTGMPRETRRYLGLYQDWSGVPETLKLSVATNTYNTALLNGELTQYPYLDFSSETNYSLLDDGTSTVEISTVETDNTYVVDSDNHVNLDIVEVVTRDADGAAVSTVTTDNDYTDNLDEWWLGRLTDTTVTHSRNNDFPNTDITRTSSFEYYPVGDTHAGMLKQENIEEGGTVDKALSTLHCYDSVGNKTKSITFSNNVTGVSCTTRNVDTGNDPTKVFRYSGVTYDSESRYVLSQQNALFTSSTIAESDSNKFGQPTRVTDINGVITDSAFDAFGRQYASKNNLGMLTESQRRLKDDAWTGTPAIADNYYFVERATASGKPTQYSYFDRLGRQVASVTQGFNAGEWIHQYSRYDEYGRTVQQSVPKKATSLAAVSPSWNMTDYDKYGRVQSITSADTTTSSILYEGLSTTTSVTFDSVHQGSQTQDTIELKNVLGEALSITDNIDGVISYFYDATGNLTKVSDVEQKAATDIVTVFDSLGRKTSMDDPNKGEWEYTYNAMGELITQTSARNHLTTFYRDSVGRTVKRVVSGGSPAVSESTQYSFAGHLLQQECELSGDSCDLTKPYKTYGYDSFGRGDSVTTVLDGEMYTQSTTFDQFGRVFQQFDASGNFQGIRQYYNAQGYPWKQVEARNSADADATIYYEAKAMDAFGNIVAFEQNDGKVTSNKAFNPLTGYATSSQANNGFLIQNNSYVFDAIGNLRTRTRNSLVNTYSKRNETFRYDGLNRLTHVNDVEQVRYQANGNIDWKFDVNNGSASYYCYNAARPHAVSGLGTKDCTSTSYQYDANGNMTSGRGRTITYAHYDKPTLISNTEGTTSFAYDNGRDRYKRETTENSVTTKTYYVGNVEVVSEGGVYKETRRYLPDAIQTQYTGGAVKTRYLHKDHLGSIDSMTDDEGKLVEKLYFDAWGKKSSIDSSQWGVDNAFRASTLVNILEVTPRGFTGHEHVDHADIIHMNGRIYDPTLGRFLQADPHIQAPKNSQSYNRYSYVLNNPLSYTDPSGYFFKKLFKAIGSNRFLSTIISIGLNFIPGCQAWCSAAFNAAITYAVTGSLKGALIGAFVGAVSPGGFNPGAFLARGILGGLASRVQGGKFGHGFIAAGASGGAGGIRNIPLRIIASAVIGGTVSKITGGKFANGATSAAFATAVTAGFDGEFSDSEGFWGENGDSILVDDPDNHGKELSLYDGKVKVSKWGSKDAKLNFKEMGTVKSDLGKIFGTEEGAKMLDALSTDEPLKILLNGEGVNAGARGSRIMTVDISARGYFKNMNTGNTVQVSTTRLFAHEMGHAISGHTDSRSINTLWTDTIMGQINQTSRRSYRNYCSTELLC